MKKILISLLALSILVGCVSEKEQVKEPRKVAVQTYTLRKNTLEESIPMLKSIGINALGCSGGQFISAKYPNVKFGPSMNQEQRDFVKKLLKDNGFVIASFGVTGAKDEAGIKAIYEFSKEMGAPVIITEAPENLLPIYEKYGEIYNIRMCIHNHGKDSKANNYYDPNVVWNLIKNYKYIYACPDIGHWSRSGIKPIDGLKALQGKFDVMHFKDQREFNNIKNENVVLGEGALNIKEVLAYLDSIGYKGYLVLENESIADNPMPDLTASVEFLRKN